MTGPLTRLIDTPDAPDAALAWDDIDAICEGLALAPRALYPATQPIAERHDLGPRGAWILVLIGRGRNTPRDLAATYRIGRSLITAELNRLNAAGLIASSPVKSDRRRSELTLTPSGVTAARTLRDGLHRDISERLAGYSEPELRLFAQMLRDVRGEV